MRKNIRDEFMLPSWLDTDFDFTNTTSMDTTYLETILQAPSII